MKTNHLKKAIQADAWTLIPVQHRRPARGAAVGAAIGAVIGSMLGGPFGAIVGASICGGVGAAATH